MTSPHVVTLGCRLNAFESEMMRGHAEAAGLTNAVIVNTCAVTAEAERQSRQAVRRARKDHPDAELIVTGCAAQLDAEGFAAIDGVDRVLGNDEKLKPESFIGADHPPVEVADIMAVRETAAHLIDGFDGRARAFVQIQQGCDHRCTFCIIPFARGPNRSVPAGAIAEQIRVLVGRGFSEVVLTGVDIASWGCDLPGKPSLGDLVRRLLRAVPELPRLRLSSIDPAVMDDALFSALAEEERLMPHLHLSLQAADDLVLKRMKRRHLVADAEAYMARARAARPDIAFGADLIAGFPTETDAQFAETLRNVERLGITYLHVFPYSEREGTPAAKMPAVPKTVRKERAQRLRDLGARQVAEYLKSFAGRTVWVLVERDGTGFSEHYAQVRIAGDVAEGALVEAAVTGSDGEALAARLFDQAA
ncbi:MAG: tRNA (N(6)-L-threonylcarbamoyladenosine(37)-C(2))-methylthiotransferase MtaB [Rhodospirillales bacterium]